MLSSVILFIRLYRSQTKPDRSISELLEMYQKSKSQIPNPSIQTATMGLPSVLFIGSTLAFSDQTIRAIAAEFPHLNSMRLSGLPDLHLFAQVHDNIALVIFEQSFADQFGDDIHLLRRACNGARMVLSYSDETVVKRTFDAMRPGTEILPVGFLPMDRPLDAWLAITGLLICGEDYLPPELLATQKQQKAPEVVGSTEQHDLETSETRFDDETLTAREYEVLSAASQGKQNKIIASDLSISEHTVKLHIHNIIRKLGVSNRTAASAWYHASLATHRASTASAVNG